MPWKKCTTAEGKSKLINAYKHKKVFKTTKKYPAPSDWIRTYEISSNEGRCQTVEEWNKSYYYSRCSFIDKIKY
jgi:hypothetical protein